MTQRRGLFAHLKLDDGFVFLVPVLYGLLVGSVAVGTVTAVETVKNGLTVNQAAEDLGTQMNYVAQQTEGKTDERSIEANKKAKELAAIAEQLKYENDYNTTVAYGKELAGIAYSAGSGLAGGGQAVRAGGKAIWNNLGAIGDSSSLPTVDPVTADYMQRVNSVRFDLTTRQAKDGAEAGLTPVPATPVEGAIAETKVEAAQKLVASVTGVEYGKARKLAEEVSLDAERNLPVEEYDLPLDEYAEEIKDRETWALVLKLPQADKARGLPQETVDDREPTREEFDSASEAATKRYFDTLMSSVAKVDRSKVKGSKGEIVLSPEDEEALKAGESATAVGMFISPMGPEPVIVTPGEGGKFTGQFPTLEKAPPIQSDSSFQLPKKQWQSWWDGSRKSCPFLYAFDGERFSAVNDIISVSRDPQREYVDRMLFDAKPGPDGMLELRVNEIRSEESFLDSVVLRAIDVPDGYQAALSPDGRVFSVRDSAAPIAAIGASALDLTFADRDGFAAYDGGFVTAEFAAPGPDAVLLVTVDGFENDGTAARFTPKRPAIRVEAFADGGWHPVGEAFPRDRADTTAFDVASYVRGGLVKVRVTGVSCDTSVYQLVDRLALSSAPSDLARLRTLAPAVEGPVADAAALLSARDNKRVHLVPGQGIRFVTRNPGADAYVIESVGWYRELTAAGQ